MKINSNFKADIRNIKHHFDKDTNGRVVTPTLVVKVKEEEAKSLLGDEFYRMVFGTMRIEDRGDKGNLPVFGWRSPLRPNVVVEKHRIKMLGYEYTCTPESPIVSVVEGEKAVTVALRLPLPGDNEAFQGKLAMAYNDTIDISMNAVQLDLPGVIESAPEVTTRKSGPFGNNRPVVLG